jgi:hypothetical protein
VAQHEDLKILGTSGAVSYERVNCPAPSRTKDRAALTLLPISVDSPTGRHRHSAHEPNQALDNYHAESRSISALPRRIAALPVAAVASRSGECGCDRAEQRSVVVVEGWPVGFAAKHTELVAQRDDLEVLAASRTDLEAVHRCDEAIQNSVHEHQGRSTFSLVKLHSRVLGPHSRRAARTQPKQASFCVPPTGTSGTSWVRPCPC